MPAGVFPLDVVNKPLVRVYLLHSPVSKTTCIPCGFVFNVA